MIPGAFKTQEDADKFVAQKAADRLAATKKDYESSWGLMEGTKSWEELTTTKPDYLDPNYMPGFDYYTKYDRSKDLGPQVEALQEAQRTEQAGLAASTSVGTENMVGVQTFKGLGSVKEGTSETFKEEEEKRASIKKKKLGARALQIPLQSTSTTQATGVASTTQPIPVNV